MITLKKMSVKNSERIVETLYWLFLLLIFSILIILFFYFVHLG